MFHQTFNCDNVLLKLSKHYQYPKMKKLPLVKLKNKILKILEKTPKTEKKIKIKISVHKKSEKAIVFFLN